MKKQFAVIGLGGFGEAVAVELMRLGHEVLGVDSDPDKANHLADKLTQTVIANATDEDALAELDLHRFDAVLVAIGAHIEASILCTMMVKSQDAKEVWVKAITPPTTRSSRSWAPTGCCTRNTKWACAWPRAWPTPTCSTTSGWAITTSSSRSVPGSA